MNLRFTLAVTTHRLVDVAVPDRATPEQMNQIIREVIDAHRDHGSQRVTIQAVEELATAAAETKPAP